ncbi:GNAT family N-acetyltransferase [Abyssalbus ytuae]|uniref:GNAT family N-acetyltransferase n=1 Tax=Abyssalbus ytuae TaxID=2926907 RepID=A0A9E7CU25_9FLAO|nr:GNAT family N-acetyltransferase [Abyssalbus ytuae]UOB19271.1 GNAT family N-acetyltransferase [Abyssalbus ytuae]
MNTRLIRTDARHKDLQELINKLNLYLRGKDGEFHEFYPQHNTLKGVIGVVILYDGHKAIGCGAFKEFDKNSAEVKRMFVDEKYRGKGVSRLILNEIEQWAGQEGYNVCMLETGKNMLGAIQFYKKNGYSFIDNYGPYVNAPNSVCMKKEL